MKKTLDVRVGNTTLTLHYLRNGELFEIDTTYRTEIKYPKYIGIAKRANLISHDLKQKYEELFEQPFKVGMNTNVIPRIKSFNLMSDRVKIDFYVHNHFYDDNVGKIFDKRIKEIFKDFRDEVRALFLEYIETNGIKYRISRKSRT